MPFLILHHTTYDETSETHPNQKSKRTLSNSNGYCYDYGANYIFEKRAGKSPIINDEWNRFAKVLDVSVEEIKVLPLPMPSKHENQVLNNRPASTNYINIPQNVFDIIINYNHKLELENQKLKNEIKVLR